MAIYRWNDAGFAEFDMITLNRNIPIIKIIKANYETDLYLLP